MVGIDIDAVDTRLAKELNDLAFEELGETPLVRVGKWPKRLLVYRASGEINCQRFGAVEILGLKSQFVAFGIHPDTQKPYQWMDGDPSNTDISRLPAIAQSDIARFITRANQLTGHECQTLAPRVAARTTLPTNRSQIAKSGNPYSDRIKWDENGKVVDGREAYLASLVFKYFLAGYATPAELANRAWVEFAANADLNRPKGSNPKQRWSQRDALTKAGSTCRKVFFQAKPRNRRSVFDRYPASRLNSQRRIGYWTHERKRQHQQEAAHRVMTPSVLVVNEAMLAAVLVDAGQCNETAEQIATRAGLSLSGVKAARKELIGLGLWNTEQDVYVPVPIDALGYNYLLQPGQLISGGVQTKEDSLYHPCNLSNRPRVAASVTVGQPENKTVPDDVDREAVLDSLDQSEVQYLTPANDNADLAGPLRRVA